MYFPRSFYVPLSRRFFFFIFIFIFIFILFYFLLFFFLNSFVNSLSIHSFSFLFFLFKIIGRLEDEPVAYFVIFEIPTFLLFSILVYAIYSFKRVVYKKGFFPKDKAKYILFIGLPLVWSLWLIVTLVYSEAIVGLFLILIFFILLYFFFDLGSLMLCFVYFFFHFVTQFLFFFFFF